MRQMRPVRLSTSLMPRADITLFPCQSSPENEAGVQLNTATPRACRTQLRGATAQPERAAPDGSALVFASAFHAASL